MFIEAAPYFMMKFSWAVQLFPLSEYCKKHTVILSVLLFQSTITSTGAHSDLIKPLTQSSNLQHATRPAEDQDNTLASSQNSLTTAQHPSNHTELSKNCITP